MDEYLIKIGEYFGVGVVSTAVFGVIWKLFLQSVVNKVIDYKLKLKEQEQKTTLESQLKVLELQTKSVYDAQDKVVSKRLEVEAVKLNRVFPYLEEINLKISNYLMLHNTYIHSVINNGGIRGDSENLRLTLDGEIIDSIHKVSIYVPREIRIVLLRIRKIISFSWKDPQILHELIIQSNLDKRDIAKKDGEILTKYQNCFLDLVSKYCSVGNEHINYNQILSNYGIDEDGKLIQKDTLTRYVEAYILFHEYTDSDEYYEISKLIY